MMNDVHETDYAESMENVKVGHKRKMCKPVISWIISFDHCYRDFIIFAGVIYFSTHA